MKAAETFASPDVEILPKDRAHVQRTRVINAPGKRVNRVKSGCAGAECRKPTAFRQAPLELRRPRLRVACDRRHSLASK